MARSLDEADAMIAAARQSGVSFAVGHTERFNPAVATARGLLTDPRFIEVHRLGTFPERSLDIDVVFDLMIHDLDVVLSLVGCRGRVHRCRRRTRPDGADRHRERAAAVRQRLHREPDGQPHQPRPRAANPILPTGDLRVHRLRGPESGALAAPEQRRWLALDPGRRRRRSKARSRSSASWPISSRPSCPAARRPSLARTGAARSGSRKRLRVRLPSRTHEVARRRCKIRLVVTVSPSLIRTSLRSRRPTTSSISG